jgi:hypothetical protein
VRTITRIRDRQQSNRVYVEVVLALDERLPNAGPNMTELAELGFCHVLRTTHIDVRLPGAAPGERVIALDVETLKPSDHVPDLG